MLILSGILTILILISILSVSITGNAIKDISNDVITIGAALPLTGVSQYFGQKNQRGMELALKEINSESEVLKVIYEDSLSKPAIAVSALKKLIDVDGVSFSLVGASSPETSAQAPIAESSQIPILALGSAAPPIRFAGDYIFRLKTSIDLDTRELMKFSSDKLDAKKISILYVQNGYGKGVANAAKEEFVNLGGEVLDSVGFDLDEVDFRAHLTKIREADPDLIVIGGWASNIGRIIKQANELGMEQLFVSPAGGMGEEVVDIAGHLANERIIYIVEFDLESRQGEVVEFREKFLEEYGEEPDLFSAMGYDSIKIISKIIKVCSDDSECIKNQLYQIQNYPGASGVISFDEYGDVQKEMVYMTIRDGEFVKL